MTLDEQLAKMRADWDQRAIENAEHYIATGREDWTDEEFSNPARLSGARPQTDEGPRNRLWSWSDYARSGATLR